MTIYIDLCVIIVYATHIGRYQISVLSDSEYSDMNILQSRRVELKSSVFERLMATTGQPNLALLGRMSRRIGRDLFGIWCLPCLSLWWIPFEGLVLAMTGHCCLLHRRGSWILDVAVLNRQIWIWGTKFIDFCKGTRLNSWKRLWMAEATVSEIPVQPLLECSSANDPSPFYHSP